MTISRYSVVYSLPPPLATVTGHYTCYPSHLPPSVAVGWLDSLRQLYFISGDGSGLVVPKQTAPWSMFLLRESVLAG